MDRPTNFHQAIIDYRQAERILLSREESCFTELAKQVVAAAEAETWEYPVRCMMCGGETLIEVRLPDAAAWEGAPRGICKECDTKATVVVFQG